MSPVEAIEQQPKRNKPSGRKNTRANRSNASTTTPIKTEPTDTYNYYNSPSTTPAERPLPFEPSLGEEGGPGAPLFDNQCTRQLSASPPPVFSYSPYPSLNPYGQPAYGSSSSLYPSSFSGTVTTPSSFSDIQPFSGDYATGPPVKRYADEGILNPFNMSYASMAGIDLGPDYHHSHSHHAHHPHHQPQLLSHLSVSQP